MEKEKYTCEELDSIVQILRSEEGCPWDRVQTFESLRACMIEEAYEYLAAVRIYGQTGNAENMCEELGDLLLQIVMNSRIAAERGLFDLSQVAEEVSKKMIRRHPHIFAGNQGVHDDGSQSSWDEIKRSEKEGKVWIESPLREIPEEHPALIRAPKVLKKLDKLYEACPDEKETIEHLQEIIGSMYADMQKQESYSGESVTVQTRVQETRSKQMGDLLIDVCNLGRIWGISLEEILQDRVEGLIDSAEAQK